jgi:protease-4
MTRAGFPSSNPALARAVAPVVDAARHPISVFIGDGGASPARRADDKRHPVTGCRADTLFGVWLMPQAQLETLTSNAWAIIEAGQLAEIKARSDELNAAEKDEPLVTVDEDGIAYLTVSGPLTKHETSFSSVMGGTSYGRIREQLREVRKLAAEGTVKGVFADADSWGGTAEGCPDCADAVRKTAEVVPIHWHAEDKCTSGMQWLASMGTGLTGSRGAHFGSVGAVLALMDRSENFRRQGMRPVIVTTGPDKAIGAPGTEITDEQRTVLQRSIEQIGEPFLLDVTSRRRLTPEQLGEVRRAGTHIGHDAVRLGLCDRITSREQALADFKTTIAQGGQSGAAPSSPSPAAIGALNMARPFKADEIARARQLPNLSGVTEDNAPELVLAAAETATRELNTANTNLGNVTRERDTARGELANAQAAAPKPLDPEVKSARAGEARARITALAASGKMNVTHKGQIEAMLGKVGEEPENLFAGKRGETVIERLLAVFDTQGGAAVAPPPTGTATGAQIPGAQGNAAQGGGAVTPVTDTRTGGEVTPAQQGATQGSAYLQQRLRQRGLAAPAR